MWSCTHSRGRWSHTVLNPICSCVYAGVHYGLDRRDRAAARVHGGCIGPEARPVRATPLTMLTGRSVSASSTRTSRRPMPSCLMS